MKYNYSESLNLYNDSEPIGYGIRGKNNMTCLINVKNDKYACLAADTWNTNPNNHYIQKIVCDQEKQIMIGSAGQNSAKYQNGLELKVLDFMNSFVKFYDGNNYAIAKKILIMTTEKFLMEMNLPESKKNICVQYIINYIKDNRIYQDLIEIIKMRVPITNLDKYMNQNIVQFNNESIIVSDIINFDNKDIWAFGVNNNPIITAGTFINTFTLTQNEILQYAKNTVQQQMDLQKHLSDSDKTVGGNIEYYCLSVE